MEEIYNCPVCEGKEFKDIFMIPYFRGDGELFQLQECKNCALRITNPRPKEGEELNAYYDTEDYVSHTDDDKGFINSVYLAVRKRALQAKLRLIEKHSNGKKLLDYGAGTGAFLSYAKEKGWTIKGIEPSDMAREQASKKGVTLIAPESRAEMQNDKFDAISLWHVLEHLPNLNEDMRFFHNSLEKAGKLVIAVPNHESLDARKYGRHWAAYDAPLHLYHFKKRNIKDLAKKHGFIVREISNMPFDAFYVSMLSEKIASKKGNLIRAFMRGLRSNMAGRTRAKNMSSLIYVLEKL